MKRSVFIVPALLAMAACGTSEPDVEETAVPEATAAPTAEPVETTAAAATEIPAGLRGRWGLVPGDCTSTRGDAKGLLVIDATTLRFYESLGTLATVGETTPTSIRATFDFEGEGMTWQRDQSLELQDDGAALVRREFGADAAPEPFRYAKCGEEGQA